jgi:4-oxalocrotonate tautomerase family enzyme
MPTILVYWSPGRNTTQKQQVVQRITDALVEEAGANRDDVLIIFQNIEAGDAAKGGQLAIPQHEPDSLD